jgi:Leucine-rich repeat (LRR) protein
MQQDERIYDELKNSKVSQCLMIGNCWIKSISVPNSVVSHILSGEGIFADSMAKLRRLDLSQNYITELPQSISILTNLREVNFI